MDTPLCVSQLESISYVGGRVFVGALMTVENHNCSRKHHFHHSLALAFDPIIIVFVYCIFILYFVFCICILYFAVYFLFWNLDFCSIINIQTVGKVFNAVPINILISTFCKSDHMMMMMMI